MGPDLNSISARAPVRATTVLTVHLSMMLEIMDNAAMKRQLHLNLFIQSRGHHEASWRHPHSSKLSLTDIKYLEGLAHRAEEAAFDSIFLGDTLALGEDLQAPHVWLEPITVLAALAVATSRIGLIGTASTTYTEPFNLARQFASLDHISNGRVGWNIVTSWLPAAARNFGDRGPEAHDDRYARGDEFVSVAKELWDSWADDAVQDDRVGGVYARVDRIAPINHAGKYYTVAGPLNVPRSPQGRPVLVQAGSSETGRRFAAKHAEAVFTAHMVKSTAQAFYSELKEMAAAEQRRSEQILVLPGLSPMIASSELEAKRLDEEANDLCDSEIGRKRLSARFGGADLTHLRLDQVLSPNDFPSPEAVQAARSRAEGIVAYVARSRPTLRQLLSTLAGARGHLTIAGTPEMVADLIEDWFRDSAADGFNIMPPVLPNMFEIFCQEVVPLLQNRGLFRKVYEGTTLRDHLGLTRPECNTRILSEKGGTAKTARSA